MNKNKSIKYRSTLTISINKKTNKKRNLKNTKNKSQDIAKKERLLNLFSPKIHRS